MYRSTKKKVVRQASISAVVALGALATGAGVASASTGSHRDGGGAVASKDSSANPAPVPGAEGPRPLGGIVTAVSGTSLTVSDPRGTVTTVGLDATTTVTKDRSASTLAALAVGEDVRIIPSAPGSTTAKSVEIEAPSVRGRVSAINGDTITLTGPNATTRTVIVSSSTTYAKNGTAATLADVSIGSSIFAQGSFVSGSTTTLDATSVGIGFGPNHVGHPGPTSGPGTPDRPGWGTPLAPDGAPSA